MSERDDMVAEIQELRERLAAAEKLAAWSDHRWSCEIRKSSAATRQCDCGYQALYDSWKASKK